MCAVCNRLHGVQVHHIVLRSEGGSDEESNAIPLCPNCHDEVHAHHAAGRITRLYTENELRGHLQRTIELAANQVALRPGGDLWAADVELVRFYVQCLDRPAFRTLFHQELSFSDLDQALEDTSLALNTGYWRTRDGPVIRCASGKTQVTNPTWRGRLDETGEAIDEARRRLRLALGLDRQDGMLVEHRRPFDRSLLIIHDQGLRDDHDLGREIDRLRQLALDCVNIILGEIGATGLRPIGEWS
jgi:hypothetical protein